MSVGTEAREGRYDIRYGDDVISFAVRLKETRPGSKVAIHVEADGRVLVDAPDCATHDAVMAVVKKRSAWIARHVADAQARRIHVRPRDYTSGEAVHYLGRRYRLRVTVDPEAAASCRLRGAYLQACVRQRDAQAVKLVTEAWYRRRALTVLSERVDAVSKGLLWVTTPPPMRLQWMRLQWGSCSPGGQITLHPGLVQAPRDCIDYVVLHELCHLKVHDHSLRFYRLLDMNMPDWRSRKVRLDAMAEELLRL